jgi:LysM repeat protein
MTDGTEHTFGAPDFTHHTTHHLDHFGDDSAAFAGHLADPSALAAADIVHGSPAAAEHDWFFQHGNTCVPASVTQVIAQFTGHPIPSEDSVLAEMTQLGIQGDMGPDGMPFTDAVKLLAGFGISSHMEEHATIHQLENHLDHGRSVIVAVNADPIWNHGHDDPNNQMGHAVLITAIDETTGMVTLSDTGNPDGNEEQVPLSVFEHAWDEHGGRMVVTDNPTPQHPGVVLMPMTVNSPSDPQPAHTISPGGSHSYTVQRGDTLWDIAERVYGDGTKYPRIAAASGIKDPNMITPGETLTIPQ